MYRLPNHPRSSTAMASASAPGGLATELVLPHTYSQRDTPAPHRAQAQTAGTGGFFPLLSPPLHGIEHDPGPRPGLGWGGCGRGGRKADWGSRRSQGGGSEQLSCHVISGWLCPSQPWTPAQVLSPVLSLCASVQHRWYPASELQTSCPSSGPGHGGKLTALSQCSNFLLHPCEAH